MKYQFTIISRWRNREKVEELTDKIRAKGKSVYSFIEGDGSNHKLKDSEQNHAPDEFMKKYESITDWQNDPAVREIFDIDMNALREAEAVVLLLPAGKSSHIEAGVAYGLGKKLILIGEQKETESLYLIFNKFYKTIDDFIDNI
ncbi:MAG: nucleoside 2-deoxyribosyltransferase domain-containing protein [Candidatus Doudnabacteria bacterium]|nr:nucleoside 2-deoxyribosyltransferase domain-containing protein [Candidatus Doudnabacteria bacterium]